MKKIKHIATPYWYRHRSEETRGISNQHHTWVKVRLMQGRELGQHPSYSTLDHWYATCMIAGEHITLTRGHTTLREVWAEMEACLKQVEPENWKLRGDLPFDFSDIVIDWPKPGYDRFHDAYQLQDGCNMSGIAQALVKAIADVKRTPGYKGNADENSDPAVVAIIGKLRSLCTISENDAVVAVGRKARSKISA